MVAKRTRVLLADDHEMVRAGLRALLNAQPGVDVVGEAPTGRAAVRMTVEMSPDVVIMDINMPDMNGIAATREIRAAGGDSKVIGLSGHPNARYPSEMLEAGASGYVLKESAFTELTLALAAVISNKVYLSPAVAGALIQGLASGQPSPHCAGTRHLSAREREVLALIAGGRSTKEIAASLHLSVKTIETHRKNIMEKLEIYSIAELTKHAIREGISTLEP